MWERALHRLSKGVIGRLLGIESHLPAWGWSPLVSVLLPTPVFPRDSAGSTSHLTAGVLGWQMWAKALGFSGSQGTNSGKHFHPLSRLTSHTRRSLTHQKTASKRKANLEKKVFRVWEVLSTYNAISGQSLEQPEKSRWVQLQNKGGAEPFGIFCPKNDCQGVLESQPLALDRNS